MKYHTLKLMYYDRPIHYRVSDEVTSWLFASDYYTYLKRCHILFIYINGKLQERINEIEKERNNESNNNS